MKLYLAKSVLGISIAAIVAPASLGAPAAPLHLKPSSKWISDYQEDGCRLLRQFGEGDDLALISLSRYGLSDGFRLTLAGKMFKREQQRVAKLQFGPAEAEQSLEFLPGTFSGLPAMVFASDMRLGLMTEQEIAALKNMQPQNISKFPRIGPKRENAVKQLKIDDQSKRAVTLELGSMQKPMAALSTCIDTLIVKWGYDLEKHKSLTRYVTPVKNPGNWIQSSEYPMDMLLEGQPAVVEFRLDVDENGNATGCYIQETTRKKEFDKAVCRGLMKRAKFQPALDADGKPLKSYYQNTVSFRV
jgi:hypothetical protein